MNKKLIAEPKQKEQKLEWWMVPLLAVVIPVGFAGLTIWMVYRIIRVQAVERLIDLIPRRSK
jgi:hypothetical protein